MNESTTFVQVGAPAAQGGAFESRLTSAHDVRQAIKQVFLSQRGCMAATKQE